MRSNRLKLASVQSAATPAPAVSLRGAHRTPDGAFDSIMRLLGASGVRLITDRDAELSEVGSRSALKLAARHFSRFHLIDGMTLHPIKARRGVWSAAMPTLDVVFVGVDARALHSHPDPISAMADDLARRLGRGDVRIVSGEDDHRSLAATTAELCRKTTSLDLVVGAHDDIEVLVAAAQTLSGASVCSARMTLNGDDAWFEDMSCSTEQSIGLLPAAELLLTLLGAHDSAERLADAVDQVLNAGMCTGSAPTIQPYDCRLSAKELIDTVTTRIGSHDVPAQRGRPVLELVT